MSKMYYIKKFHHKVGDLNKYRDSIVEDNGGDIDVISKTIAGDILCLL